MLYSFIQARNVFCQMILLHDVGEDITFLVFMAERIVVAAEGYELCWQAHNGQMGGRGDMRQSHPHPYVVLKLVIWHVCHQDVFVSSKILLNLFCVCLGGGGYFFFHIKNVL